MARLNRLHMLAALAIVGCQSAPFGNVPGLAPTQEPASNFIGYVTMSQDGVLHMNVSGEEDDGEIEQWDIPPSSSEYELARQQADGIQPGETRRLRRIIAIVSMREDRSLLIQYFPVPDSADENSDIEIEPGPPQAIPTGHPQYDDLIRRAGGLQPGQWRAILAGRDARHAS